MKRIYLIIAMVFLCLPNMGFAQGHLNTYEWESRMQRMINYPFSNDNKEYQTAKKKKPRINRVYLLAIENTTDEATGLTTLRWNDGSSYVGETYRTVFHGMGTMIYPDKGKYYGQWKYSHRDGIGTMVYPDKSKYVGSWERDLPNGSGTFQTPEGITFTVNFENGLPHGKGVIQDLDGRLYSARWVRGVLKEKSIKPYKEE